MRDLLHEVPTVPDAEQLARSFAALANPVRVQILAAIACGEAATMDGLAAVLGLPAQTVWRHLQVLLKAGVLARTDAAPPYRYVVAEAALRRLAGALGVFP